MRQPPFSKSIGGVCGGTIVPKVVSVRRGSGASVWRQINYKCFVYVRRYDVVRVSRDRGQKEGRAGYFVTM